jgi:hypothetical protein
MVKLSDIFYFNFLKKGAIIVAILGILLGILVVGYSFRWINGVHQTSSVSVKVCSNSTDCIEHCGECVSIVDSRVCAQTGLQCACLNSTCHETA